MTLMNVWEKNMGKEKGENEKEENRETNLIRREMGNLGKKAAFNFHILIFFVYKMVKY